MIINIYYFSGTGNTKWAGEGFMGILSGKGHECRMMDIANPGEIPDADVSVLASPIYAADYPRIVRKFISSHDFGTSEIFMLNTFGYINAAGYFLARKYFRKVNMRISGYINLRMTDTAPTGKSDKYGYEIDLPMKKKLIGKLEKASDSLLKRRKTIQGLGPWLMGGIVVRKALSKGIRDNYKNMKVDMAKCIKCLECVRGCPSESISVKNGSFTFSEGCEACMRCINHCPRGAISNR